MLGLVVTKAPAITYRRASSLKDQLVKSEFKGATMPHGLNEQISFRPYLEGFASGGCEKESFSDDTIILNFFCFSIYPGSVYSVMIFCYVYLGDMIYLSMFTCSLYVVMLSPVCHTCSV